MTVWRKRWTRIARKPLRIAGGAGALARVGRMFLLITPGFLNLGSCSRNLSRCKMTVRNRYTPPRSKTLREKIRAAIRAVPRGKVSTYGAVARAAGYPRGARQVVQTLRHSVGLPWHRILGAGGEIKLHGTPPANRGRNFSRTSGGYEEPSARLCQNRAQRDLSV